MDQRQSKVIEQRHMTQKFHSHLYGAKQLPIPWPKQPPFPFEDATIWNYIFKITSITSNESAVHMLTSISHQVASPDLVEHYRVQSDLLKFRCVSDKKTCVADTNNVYESHRINPVLYEENRISLCAQVNTLVIFFLL